MALGKIVIVFLLSSFALGILIVGGPQTLLETAMIILPCVPYFPQYKLLIAARSNSSSSPSSSSFSPAVPILLLFANIVRIFFWVCHRFSSVLLLQSICMIFTQTAILHACCVGLSSSPSGGSGNGRENTLLLWEKGRRSLRLTEGELGLSFCLLCLILSSIVYTAQIHSSEIILGEVLGYFALGGEALMAVPQAMKNHASKSTAGLSRALIFAWIIGDTSKLLYFVVGNHPLQFHLCAIFQILMDCVIFIQIRIYRKTNQIISSSSTSHSNIELAARGDVV